MPTNYWMFFVAGLIPLFIGAAYYSKALLGKSWMKVNGFRDADLEGGNMAVILGLAYLLSVLFSFALSGMVLHQSHLAQMMLPDIQVSGSAAQEQFNALISQYGGRYRTFSHGALHGGLVVVFFVLPIIAINALFERRGAKYIFIHAGYWFISACLVGGLLCATLEYPTLS